MASSQFIESLVGVRSEALRRRLTRDLGWSQDVAEDFLTRVGLGLLSGLRNHPERDIARLREEPELFALVAGLDLRQIATQLPVDPGDAWRGARWTAGAIVDTLLDRRDEGLRRLAGAASEA